MLEAKEYPFCHPDQKEGSLCIQEMFQLRFNMTKKVKFK
jgi:hypothetical protein